MPGQPKKTSSSFQGLDLKTGKPKISPINRFRLLLSNSHTIIPLVSGFLLIVNGLIVVSITILGLITPFWISAILCLLGSVSSMGGVFLIYQTVSCQGSFESLINKAIRRVIKSQN